MLQMSAVGMTVLYSYIIAMVMMMRRFNFNQNYINTNLTNAVERDKHIFSPF